MASVTARSKGLAKKAQVVANMNKKKALYLRKSRDESGGTADVLSKHRMTLVELCQKNGWEYVTYEEIGSSDSLDNRPKMVQLLDDVEDGLYDAVVVMDYDRLSRGDELDHAFIKRIFRKAGVKVITPTRIYDLEDEGSELLMGVEALMSRAEYRRIKRRLQAGKLSGAQKGNWVQGNPPFPYHYDKLTKMLVVEEEKRPHYGMMKADALNGMSPGDIAIKLNRMGVKTNRGGTWVAETVLRVLLNQVHMGKVIYGKSKTDQDGNRVMLGPDDWVTGEGQHERLKTPDEHARLIALIASRRRIATKSREGKTPLSGLVKCARCGKTHQSTLHRGHYVLFACQRKAPTGEKCPNGGVHAEVVYRSIDQAVETELERLRLYVEEVEGQQSTTGVMLENMRRELATLEEQLSRLVDLALSGMVTKEMFAQKKAPIEADIRRTKEEIAALEMAEAAGEMPKEERLEKLESILKDFWTSDHWTDKERHTLLTTLIDHCTLYCDRKRNLVSVKVVFRK